MVGTDRLRKEVAKSNTVVSYVDAFTATAKTIRLTAVDGGVSVDGTAAIRRSCSVSCVDPLGTLTPEGQHSDIAPYGTEIRPYRGCRYDDGTEEVVPLGVFRISKVNVTDSADGGVSLAIEAYDRSRTIQRDKFTDTYVIGAGANIVVAIKYLVERTFPDAEYDTISTPRVTTAPIVYDINDDPWEAITALALSLGCVAYFDVYGVFVLTPASDADALSSPDLSLVEGEDCTMIELSREFSDEPGFNGVVVTGESPGDDLPPVRAEVWDEESTSATYRYGPYGEVPYHHNDQNAKTVDDATAVGKQILSQMLGATATVSVTSMVNPTLEVGSVVAVKRARSHVDGVYTAEAFDIPLLAQNMQGLTLRERRVVG